MNILNILSKKILNKFINFNELRVRIKIDLSLSHKLNIEPIIKITTVKNIPPRIQKSHTST